MSDFIQHLINFPFPKLGLFLFTIYLILILYQILYFFVFYLPHLDQNRTGIFYIIYFVMLVTYLKLCYDSIMYIDLTVDYNNINVTLGYKGYKNYFLKWCSFFGLDIYWYNFGYILALIDIFISIIFRILLGYDAKEEHERRIIESLREFDRETERRLDRENYIFEEGIRYANEINKANRAKEEKLAWEKKVREKENLKDETNVKEGSNGKEVVNERKKVYDEKYVPRGNKYSL